MISFFFFFRRGSKSKQFVCTDETLDPPKTSNKSQHILAFQNHTSPLRGHMASGKTSRRSHLCIPSPLWHQHSWAGFGSAPISSLLIGRASRWFTLLLFTHQSDVVALPVFGQLPPFGLHLLVEYFQDLANLKGQNRVRYSGKTTARQ